MSISDLDAPASLPGAGVSAPGRVLACIHRFGQSIIGGAERLAWRYCIELAHRGHQVEVVTTCAGDDYMTWENALPAGVEAVPLDPPAPGSLTIRRFPVEHPRHVASFNRLSNRAFRRPDDRALGWRWMLAQGPDAPALAPYVARHRQRFDAAIVFNYLYKTTYDVLPLVADRAVLMPFAHDEPPLRLGLFRPVFSGAAVLGTSSAAEERLIIQRFHPYLPPRVQRIGSGIDLPPSPPDLDRARQVMEGFLDTAPAPVASLAALGHATARQPEVRQRLLAGDFCLLLGRQSPSKNTHLATHLWQRLQADGFSATDRAAERLPLLLVVGPLERGFQPEWPLTFGAVPEEVAGALRQLALASLHVSTLESLNVEALHAQATGTPLLVADDCLTTMELAEPGLTALSLGRLHEGSLEPAPNLAETLARLRDPVFRAVAARHARHRAEVAHAWPAVLGRLEMAVATARAAGEAYQRRRSMYLQA